MAGQGDNLLVHREVELEYPVVLIGEPRRVADLLHGDRDSLITALDRHPERYGADCASMLLSLLSAEDSPGGEDSRLLERADAGSPLIARQSTLRA